MEAALKKTKNINDAKLKYRYQILFNLPEKEHECNFKTIFRPQQIEETLTALKLERPPNDTQLQAIEMSLRNELTIIQGPPGTGKTETCIKIIQTMLRQNRLAKLLVCAGSNAAVNVIALRLQELGIKVARIFSIHHVGVDPNLETINVITLAIQNSKKLGGREKNELYRSKQMNDKEIKEYE